MSEMDSKDFILSLRFMSNKKSFALVGKMAQQIKMFAIQPDNTSSTPWTHMVKDKTDSHKLSCALLKGSMVSAHTHTHL